MFGTSSFAQTPFASLAGVNITLSLTEGIQSADASTALYAFIFNHTEAVTESAVEITGAALFFGSVTEAMGLDDPFAVQTGFLLSATENLDMVDSAGIAASFITIAAEDVGMADVLVPYFEALQVRNEPFTVGDSSVQQSAFLQAISENSQLADAPTAIAQFPQAVTENLVSGDINAITAQFVQAVTEGATVADVIAIIQSFTASVIENMTAAEAEIASQGFYLAVVEALRSADSSTQTFAFLQSITENVALLDSFGVGGWIKIINDQASGWTLINNKTSTMTGSWNACAASPSAVVLLNRDAQGAYLLVTNGGTRTLQLPSTDYYGAVTYVNGRFYVFNTSEGAGAVPLLRSIDGVTWEVVNKPVTTRPVVSVFGNGTQLGLVIRGVAPIGTYSYISTDNGATWTQGGTPASGGDQSGQVVWDGTKYVRCLGSYISTSTDGLNWSYHIFSSGKVRGQIVWDGTTYVAVLSAQELLVNLFPSEVYVSNDGTSWTLVPEIPASRTASVLTRFAGGFVILNSSGAVLQLNPVNQIFTALSQIPDIVFPLGSYQGATAATRNGVTYLPGERPSAYDGTYLTTTNFTVFTPNAIANFWTGIDDSQNPNWQNTSSA